MKLVANIDEACSLARVDVRYAEPIEDLLKTVIREGIDGIAVGDARAIRHKSELGKCLVCVESSQSSRAIAGEKWADAVDDASPGGRKRRVDILAFVKDGGEEKILLAEGKLGCSVNEAGRSLHPRHAELKEKYEETRGRLSAAGNSLPVVDELYLLVSGLYKAQIKRRMFMWRRQGLIPMVKCLCCHEFLEELGVPDSSGKIDSCETTD